MAQVKLYGFVGSNAVYTGRLLVEHKGIDYDFVRLPPAAHALILLARGFDTMSVPALRVGDVRVQGTRWIARTLDELYPSGRCSPPIRRAGATSRTPSAGARSSRTPRAGCSTARRAATRGRS